MNAKLLYLSNAQLGEGAIWNSKEQQLYWVDIEGRTFNVFYPLTSQNVSYPTGKRIGAVVPARNGEVLIALEDGIAIMTLPGGQIDYQLKTNIHIAGKRFNDGKCDPAGRFWVGSLTIDNATNDNKLYSIDADFSITEKLYDLSISNGIVWSNDERYMYHIDTLSSKVTRHDFDIITGHISNKKVVISIPDEMGYPDGMTIDSEGMLWIALWNGYGVARFDPFTGKLLQKVNVPAPKVTSCAFGGKNLDQLFITTARVEMSDDELKTYPLSGGLFIAEVGVNGVPATSFKLR